MCFFGGKGGLFPTIVVNFYLQLEQASDAFGGKWVVKITIVVNFYHG